MCMMLFSCCVLIVFVFCWFSRVILCVKRMILLLGCCDIVILIICCLLLCWCMIMCLVSVLGLLCEGSSCGLIFWIVLIKCCSGNLCEEFVWFKSLMMCLFMVIGWLFLLKRVMFLFMVWKVDWIVWVVVFVVCCSCEMWLMFFWKVLKVLDSCISLVFDFV